MIAGASYIIIKSANDESLAHDEGGLRNLFMEAVTYKTVCEQLGCTTGKLGSTGEGQHSWHSRMYLPLLSSQDLDTILTTTSLVEQPEDGPCSCSCRTQSYLFSVDEACAR